MYILLKSGNNISIKINKGVLKMAYQRCKNCYEIQREDNLLHGGLWCVACANLEEIEEYFKKEVKDNGRG